MSESVNVLAEGRRLVEAFYVTIDGVVALEDADWVDVKWALSEACDHIERLEAKVKELEAERAAILKLHTSVRVYQQRLSHLRGDTL